MQIRSQKLVEAFVEALVSDKKTQKSLVEGFQALVEAGEPNLGQKCFEVFKQYMTARNTAVFEKVQAMTKGEKPRAFTHEGKQRQFDTLIQAAEKAIAKIPTSDVVFFSTNASSVENLPLQMSALLQDTVQSAKAGQQPGTFVTDQSEVLGENFSHVEEPQTSNVSAYLSNNGFKQVFARNFFVENSDGMSKEQVEAYNNKKNVFAASPELGHNRLV